MPTGPSARQPGAAGPTPAPPKMIPAPGPFGGFIVNPEWTKWKNSQDAIAARQAEANTIGTKADYVPDSVAAAQQNAMNLQNQFGQPMTTAYDQDVSGGLGMLKNEAMGGPNSVGQTNLRNQGVGMLNRVNAEQRSMAAGGRGSSGVLGARAAAQNSAMAGSQAAGGIANAAGQLQLGAMGQYNSAAQNAQARGLQTQLGQQQNQLGAAGLGNQAVGMEQTGMLNRANNNFAYGMQQMANNRQDANKPGTWQKLAGAALGVGSMFI